MLSHAEIDAANEYGEALRVAVHERELPANERVRAAAGRLAIAQDIHHAIVKLIESQLYAGAFALVRVAFEAYVRGEWLSLCAKNNQVRRFLKGAEPPRMDLMLEDLEKQPAFSEQVLSQIKRRTWKAMCGYTHVGGLHVQRWVTSDGIEPNYSAEEVREALRFADIIVGGWKAYFGIAEVLSPLREIDKWVRRRLRCYAWKQWGSAGYRELRKRGVTRALGLEYKQERAWPMATEQNASIKSGTACKTVSSNGAARVGTGQGSMRATKFQGTAGYVTRMSGGVGGRGREASSYPD